MLAAVKKILCITFLLLISEWVGAQTFPVQVTTQLNVPYSLTLSDYASADADRIVFSIFADVSRPELQVKFRLRIEGQNVTFQTRQDFTPPPVTIQGGVTERFTGFDLAAYFDPANLTFQGITRQQFQKTGKLPEGLYRFQLEVVEYNRNIKISNTGTAAGWLILNDPPLVNLPRQNEKLRAQDPQNVVIQWTPRHTGSPNAAFSTEYEITMVEVWPSTRNPNDAILTSQPILEATTNATTFIYGPAEVALEPGRRYAIRIRAKAIAGVNEVDLFKNQGYSEVVTFIYGDACDLPTGIKADAISSSRVGLQWESMLNHTGYSIKYRAAGSNNWYESNPLSTEAELASLKPATRYEYQVAAGCGPFKSAYSPIAVVTTKEEPAIAYSCGLPMDPFNLDPAELAPSLSPGDIIQAGDFNVTLARVEGSNGTFSGEGVIVVPYFNKAKVKTEFSGIKVNKELRMVAGEMKVTGAGVDVIPPGLLDLMDDLEEGLDLLDSALNVVESNLPEAFDPNSFVADTLVNVSAGISSVYKDDDGTVVIVDKNGQETRLPAGTTAAVTDGSGNAYLVDSKGNVHKTDAATATKAGNREYNLTLKFAAADNGKYGFDEKKYEPLAERYETIDGNYTVAWKALPIGQPDPVIAKLEGQGIDLSKIRYEKGGQSITPLPNPAASGSHLLQLTGLSDGEEGLLALYAPADESGKEQVLGKLNVVTYKEISKKLVVVPVNGNAYKGSAGSLSTRLNKIYNQAVVQWNVSIADNIQVPGISPFDDGDSGLLTNYTPDMKKVISAYKDKMSDDTYYLFLVSNPKNNAGLLGYMPRSKPAGFIFVNNLGTEEAMVHTIAHELGHGVFNLQHTFSDDSKGGQYKIPEGTTDNLMDYTSNFGTRLYKHQWDKIRYNDIVIGMLEKDEESESVIVMNIEELKGWEYNDVAYPFLASSGQVILVPKTIKNLEFSTGDVTSSKDENIVKIIPFGTLISFNIGGIKYVSTWNEKTNTHTGFFAGEKAYAVTDFIPLEKLNKPLEKVIIGIPVFSGGGFNYRVQLVENTFTDVDTIKAKGYTTKGIRKNYDFLNGFFTSDTNVKLLSAPPSFFNNQSVINFIRYYIKDDEKDNPAYGLYLYTHATLLDNYGLLNSCFATGLPGRFLKNVEKFRYTVMKFNMRMGDYYPDTQSIPFPNEFELNDETTKAFKYLMSKWADVDINYYKELSKLVATFKAVEIPSDVTKEKTGELLSIFDNYNNLETDNFNCVFSELTIKNKQNLLKHLLSTSNDDLGNRYEKVSLKILESLKEEEIYTVFTDFKKDTKLLYNAYQKCDNLLNSKYITTLMYGINKGWGEAIKVGLYDLPSYEKLTEIATAIRDNKDISSEQFKTLINHPKLILLEDEKLFTGTDTDLILKSSWDSKTYKVAISQTKDVINSYGKVFLDLFVARGSSYLFESQEGKQIANLDPLAPVLIMITKKQVKDLGLQLDPGIYAVPAILVYWVSETQQSEIRSFYLRIALDVLAIALAPLTGGGSVALITLEIGIAATDIAMTLTKEQLSAYNDSTFFEIYDYWDKTYMAYGATLAGIGLFKSAPSLVSGVKNTARLIASPKAAGRLIRAKTITKLKELKDFDILKLADKIDELATALKAQWAGYSAELRSMASSIRLNAELRYVSLYSRLEGYVNPSTSDFLISNGNVYGKLFKYRIDAGVHYASEIRFLRNNTSNVKKVRFAGELENVRYTDNGKDINELFIVEDLDNPNSFFAVTETEINSGLKGIDNYDDVLKDYKTWRQDVELPPIVITSTVSPVRGAKKSDFINTVADFANGANAKIADEAWELWKQQKWSQLEDLFRANSINGKWPPMNGSVGNVRDLKGRDIVKETKVYDRFQGPGDISGEYASPVYSNEGINDLYFTYDSRALKYNIAEGTNYIKFEFVKEPPPNLIFERSQVIPWYGKQGLGDQVKSNIGLKNLEEGGYIKITERSEFRGGKWVSIVDDVSARSKDIIQKVKLNVNISGCH